MTDSKYQKAMTRVKSMIHFKELRSGKDMAYLMRRSIKFDRWSKGKSARHLVSREVFDNSYFTVYDYDLRLEFLVILLALLLLARAIFT